MFSDKENVNVLTSLLVVYGVRHAVVCPGSRNAPIVHNLDACGDIRCYPVTDERSAGFYAMGLCQVLCEPVVVCVTSGTALLNLCPAVAEAFYQHLPLVVVSADRPNRWINQLDGQTLPQAGAFGSFVRCSVSLPESCDEEEHWYCNRMLNEAMIACMQGCRGPVHINVPIAESLYTFNVKQLPKERKICFLSDLDIRPSSIQYIKPLQTALQTARRPLIVIGQAKPSAIAACTVDWLTSRKYVVLNEALSVGGRETCLEETMHLVGGKENFLPDFILYVGDVLVSKRVKQFLRSAKHASCWIVNPEGCVHDTFKNLQGVVQARPNDILMSINSDGNEDWFNRWEAVRQKALAHHLDFQPNYSNMLAVKFLEERLVKDDTVPIVHYANSISVRLGCIYAWHHIYCNRGVNGIEGSLSTAGGYSLATNERVYCVIGDLSFFYDQNALWNQNLKSNLRILLLNNHGGEIFGKFEGLRQSSVRNKMVMAKHSATAEGICQENNIRYYSADDPVSLEKHMETLTSEHSDRPILLEVFTDCEEDLRVYKEYFNTL